MNSYITAMYQRWRDRTMAESQVMVAALQELPSRLAQRIEERIHQLHETYARDEDPTTLTLDTLRQVMEDLGAMEMDQGREADPSDSVEIGVGQIADGAIAAAQIRDDSLSNQVEMEGAMVRLLLTPEELEAGIVCVIFTSINPRVMPLYYHMCVLPDGVRGDRPCHIVGQMYNCDGMVATDLRIVQALVSKDGGPFAPSVNVPTYSGSSSMDYNVQTDVMRPHTDIGPTIVCTKCPKIFSPNDAYKSLVTGDLVCPECFEDRKTRRLAKEVEPDPNKMFGWLPPEPLQVDVAEGIITPDHIATDQIEDSQVTRIVQIEPYESLPPGWMPTEEPRMYRVEIPNIQVSVQGLPASLNPDAPVVYNNDEV